MNSFQPAESTSLMAFLSINLAVIAAFGWGVYRTSDVTARIKSTAIAVGSVLIWLGAFGAIIAYRWVGEALHPRVMMLFMLSNLISVGIALSPAGRRMSQGLPLAALVGFQAFRLPLELVLHSWATQGTIPETMTWTGQNLDIITGIAALFAAPFANRFRAAAWVFNFIGIALLINVARVAVLSSPLPFAWPLQRKLLLILHLPYAWIVPVCVGGALAGHIILTRALLAQRKV